MKKINTVGVVGAGTMGSALAQKFAQEGFTVILTDREQRFIERGLQSIERSLDEGLNAHVFTPEQVAGTLSRIRGVVNLDELRECELIVEAIFENLVAKKTLFAELDMIVGAETVLATNTSSFSVTDLSGCVSHPERFVGLHYFFHAAKNRLVEIIPGSATSDDVIYAMKKFAFATGKDAITCRDSYGFVVNRFFVPWLNEACRLLEENVASIATIDDVCKMTFGVGMGPFALMNATGVPVAYHSAKTLEIFGGLYAPSAKLEEQTRMNQDWSLEGDVSSDAQIRTAISERMLGVEFLVCSQMLDEAICSPTDINRGARIGLKWKKGPVELMKMYGESTVQRLIASVAARYQTSSPLSVNQSHWALEFVTLERSGSCAVVTMTRPEDLNALNEESVKQLAEKFAQAEMDPDVQTIFITGSGKAFVAGADVKFFIKNIKAHSIDKIESFTRYAQDVFELIDASSKKVVAVLNGSAFGGGLELALCADLIVALPNAAMAFPETGIGIYPGLGGTQRCTRRIGKALSKYMIHTGKTMIAPEARDIGLIDAIVSVDQMFDLMTGKIPLPLRSRQTLSDKWLAVQAFFESNSLSEIIGSQTHDTLLPKDEAARLCKSISFKAPVALRIADSLIDEGKSCSDELHHLKEIFGTNDALLGLSNIGKKVAYTGN